jgi:hypothetical protein
MITLILERESLPQITVEVGQYTKSIESLAYTVARNFTRVVNVVMLCRGKEGENKTFNIITR